MTIAPLFGMLGLAAVAAPLPADYGKAEHVVIELSNFSFAPATIHLKAGRPIVLHLINRSAGAHDFTAPKFFAAASINPADANQVRGGKVSLAGGQQLLVGMTPAAGRYPVKCSRLLHKSFGMSGEVVVTW